jgi:glutamate-5-semialdehyde dehydrogenase
MSKYVKIIGKKARKAIENKIDSRTKNRVLKKFLILLKKNEKKIF